MTYKEPIHPNRPFKRGDLVEVMNADHSVCGGPYRVKSATKKFAALDDGRKFQQSNGYWSGDGDSYPFPWLRHSEGEVITCKQCSAEIDALAVFPGGICLKCHEKKFNAELAKNGGILPRPNFRNVFAKH